MRDYAKRLAPGRGLPDRGVRSQHPVGISICLVLICLSVARAADVPRLLTAGEVEVTASPWSRGIGISVGGIVVSGGSNMVITTPPWAPHYYLGPDETAVRTAAQALVEGGTRLTISHRGEHDSFTGEDVITATKDGRVERVFEGRFNKDEGEALIQWMIAGLNPTLIIGRPFKAVLADGSVKEGTVPVVPVSGETEPCTLAKGFRTLEFDSRIGPIRIDVDSPHPVICYDYRRNRWSDPARPLFWLGDMGTRFRKGEPIRYRIVFHLPLPEAAKTDEAPMKRTTSLTRRDDAQTWPLDGPPTLIPKPKNATFAKGGFQVTSSFGGPIVNAKAPDLDITDAPANDLKTYLHDRFDIAFDTKEPQGTPLITLKPATDLPEEGYALQVTPDGITVQAASEAGLRHAIQTIKQLAVRLPDGKIMIRSADIRDWPALPIRGVHLFTGGQGPDLHLKLLRNVLGPLKMNTLVMQAEYTEWDTHPEIHHPEYGMPKSEVRAILDTCRALGIEAIPLVMSLGHCQWMFETGHNLDLAEDPDAIWAYCVTNPKTYEFIHEIYEEAIELFKPKTFHIGHDEFHHRGRVPYRESSKLYSVEELFTMDTLRHYEWFKERGIRVMMWGDMLLGEGEGPDACHAASAESAKKLRDQTPKDIFIADWHYVDTAPENYVNLKVLHSDGFETVASTWSRPGNVVHFAQAAHTMKSRGLLQTTWAGYSLDPARFQKEMQQYAMYVIAAEAAWNADNPPDPDAYPYGSY
ncbi:MAG: beta-N-acetylhexosaminidase, partial [Phycisphaerae bacterium]|nr:beta-N-acetylhexosaminidase [Phycisphaerae bacterium]